MSEQTLSLQGQQTYRWLECEHPDLYFYNVPRRFPWPREESTLIDLKKEFPFQLLARGIHRLQRDKRVKLEPVWRALVKILNESGELVDAMERSDYVRAEQLLRRLDALHPECPFICFNQAYLARLKNDKRAAIELYAKATRFAPNLEYLWMRLGETLEEVGEKDGAIQAYRKALGLLPGHREAYEGLARLGEVIALGIEKNGVTTGKYVDKLEYRELMEKAHSDCAGDISALLKLAANVRADKFCLDLALPPIDEALQYDGSNSEALIHKGAILRDLKRMDEAETLLVRGIKLQKSAWGFYELALLMRQLGRTDAMRESLQKSLIADVNYFPALCALFLKSDDASCADLATYAAEKKSWRAYQMASTQAFGAGDIETGLKYAAAACEVAPAESEPINFYSGALLEADQPERAAAILRPRKKNICLDLHGKWNLARALHKMKLTEQAVEILETELLGKIDDQWRERIEGQIARWTGLLAQSDVPLEIHGDKELLRRPIYLVEENQVSQELFQPGIPLGMEYQLKLERFISGDRVSITLRQGVDRSSLPARELGVFEVELVNSAETAFLHLKTCPGGSLEARAFQGSHKLPITWRMYKRPQYDEDHTVGE